MTDCIHSRRMNQHIQIWTAGPLPQAQPHAQLCRAELDLLFDHKIDINNYQLQKKKINNNDGIPIPLCALPSPPPPPP